MNERFYILHAGFGNKPWDKSLDGFETEAEAMELLRAHNSSKQLLVCRGPYTAERFAELNAANGWRVVDGRVESFDRYSKPKGCRNCGKPFAECSCTSEDDVCIAGNPARDGKCGDPECVCATGEGCEVCGCSPCSCDEPCAHCQKIECECDAKAPLNGRTICPRCSLVRAVCPCSDAPGTYRKTASGSPSVPDLVARGALIATNYGTGGRVVEVTGPHSYGPDLESYSITYVPEGKYGHQRDSDLCWINELVAVDGRILKLFAANSDEVLLVGEPRPAQNTRGQLSLF